MNSFPHGSLLERKSKTISSLIPVLDAYKQFVDQAKAIEVVDHDSVRKLVEALNNYRNKSIYLIEGGKNVPQSNLRSTIMEEFLGWLFKDIFKILEIDKPSNFQIGKANGSYLSLDFAPASFEKIFTEPNPCFHTKDQDFALGATIAIQIFGDNDNSVSKNVLLPVIAIECKTYLAKNHLDMCSSTAASLKKAMPYCQYIILTEFLKLSNTATPEFTDISEIFVVCKAKNTERKVRKDKGLPPHIVHEDVIISLFDMVMSHLKSIWWNPDSVLERGTVIGRPS